MNRQTKKSAVTREKVYLASIDLMKKNGFQDTTIRDICNKANVSVGTFYCYFKSKNDVLKELYLNADKFFYQFVANEIFEKEFFEKLNLFVYYYAKLNTETGLDMLRVLYSPWNEWFAQTRPMQDVLLDIITDGQKIGKIRTDLSAEEITGYFFTTLRGVCYDWCVNNAKFDMEQRMQEYLIIILEGIKSRN